MKCFLLEIRITLESITVAQRPIQLIFQFVNFLASGGSFGYIKVSLWIFCSFRSLIGLKIMFESCNLDVIICSATDFTK